MILVKTFSDCLKCNESSNRWLVAIAAFWMRFLYEGISTSYGVILPLVSEEFSTDLSTATLPGTFNFGIGTALGMSDQNIRNKAGMFYHLLVLYGIEYI